MKTFPLVLVLVLASGPLVSGHHSFAAHYFEEQLVTVQGTLVEFEYRAPHAWVHLSVTDDGGAIRRYAAEWANPNRLSRDGITKETLKAGDVRDRHGQLPGAMRARTGFTSKGSSGRRTAGVGKGGDGS